MKKTILVLLLLASVFLFSSCTVQIGHTVIDLPWWVVTLFVTIPTLAAAGLFAFVSTSENRNGIYVCSHCQHRFKPGMRILWSPHVMDEYVLTCPHCKKRDWCSMSYDQDK